MKPPDNGALADGSPTGEGEKKNINSELWHACAGPLVSLPPVGTLVVYFPQGHSEQVAATMQKEMDTIPNYPSLPSQLICLLHSATLHADAETDEVYAQMTLQPINKYDKEGLLASDLGLKQNRQPAEFFCKTLTASDTSTHGGFSVPRRAAEKIFPLLDFSKQPPAQELTAKDLHDVAWTFRHVYRGQPKRHLLTTGWSVFVSTKRLVAGDSVLFIRDEKSQLLLGIRRSNRQQPALSSSVLSTDSMHIGVLAAAAHAAANNSPFTIFYNPRASPSEFVIPLAKYNKAMYAQVSLGMRFRMMFETEESGVRRYMGTITGISDLDPVRWKGSQWRSLQVGWDESTTGERRNQVSVWEIDPVVSPFYMCPPFFRPKLATPDNESDVENSFKHVMQWLGNDVGLKDSQNPMLSGLSLVQWMSMQRNPLQMTSATQSSSFPAVMASALRNSSDESSVILNFQSNASPLSNLQFSVPKSNPVPQTDGKQPTSLVQVQLQQQQLLQQTQQVQQSKLLQHQQLMQQHQQFQQQLHMQQQEQRQPQDHIALLTQQQRLQKASDMSAQQMQQAILHQLLLQQQQQLQQVPHNQLANNPVNQQQQMSLQHHALQKQHASSVHLIQGQQLEQSFHKHLPHQDCQLQASQHQQLRSHVAGAAEVDLLQQRPQKSVQTPGRALPVANQLIQSSQPQVQLETTVSVTSNPCIQQLSSLPGNSTLSQSTASQNLQFHELSQQNLAQQQQQQLQQIVSQVELLQKLQQQQMLSLRDSQLLSQLTQQQLPIQQNHVLQHKPLGQQQPGGMLLADPLKGQPTNCCNNPANHTLPSGEKPGLPNDPTRCSNSEYDTSPVQPLHLLQKIKERVLPTDTAIHSPNNMVLENHCKPVALNKSELQDYKTLPAHLSYQDAMADQLDASSSATSFCMDKSGEESFSVPICLDGEEQGNDGNHLVYRNVDGLMAEALCSTGFGSEKDIQHVLSGYGHQREIDTEISTAAIGSQSIGAGDNGFRPEFSNGTVVHDNGLINKGSWPSQPRMRTYTKVQKRGSVGRCIDLTRYGGYEQLRHDLACMFGIDGQLEDPHRSDWKLVYVDHEKDVLLVGDDPWEEFVSCVQSLKILSAVEVQQMSLDGDLGGIPAQTQACSGSDNNGNLWRTHYESHSTGSDR